MSDRNEDGTFGLGNKGGGRPTKKYSLTSMLRELGSEVTADGRTRAEVLAATMWSDAEGGDKVARKEIMDRLEGKPKERIEVEGDSIVRIIFDDDRQTASDAPEAEGVLEEPV
jgi:hypothetical protein